MTHPPRSSRRYEEPVAEKPWPEKSFDLVHTRTGGGGSDAVAAAVAVGVDVDVDVGADVGGGAAGAGVAAQAARVRPARRVSKRDMPL